MPKLANIKVNAVDPATAKAVPLECACSIDSDGVFAATLPDYIADLAMTMTHRPGVRWTKARLYYRLESQRLEDLRQALEDLLKAFLRPEITTECVIRYNIESHVSFATGSDEQIYPNARFPETKWVDDKSWYGNHHGAQPAKGGYSLTIGARAYNKRTIKRGDAVRVEYAYINSGDDLTDPLNLLNAWCSFTLPEHGLKEMPYTPEAALFFHRMMLGIAELSRRVQTFMHDEQALFSAINRGANLLPTTVD